MWPNSLSMVICLYNQVLAEGCPQGVIVEGFLGPQQLASIFTHAILNVHTAPYEAYGMTIVEAAAFGAPSVVHDKDIGACELLPRAAPRGSSVGLGSEEGASVGLDMRAGAEALARELQQLLSEPGLLRQVGEEGRRCAMRWGEDAFAMELLALVTTSVAHTEPSLQ